MNRPTVLHHVASGDRDAVRLIAAMTASRGFAVDGRAMVRAGVRHRASLLHAHGLTGAADVARAARLLRVPWLLSLGDGDLTNDPAGLRAAAGASLVVVSSRAAAEQVAAAGLPAERVVSLPIECAVELAEAPVTQSATSPLVVGIVTGVGEPQAELLLREAAGRVARVLSGVSVVEVRAGDVPTGLSVLLAPGMAREPASGAALRRLVVGGQIAGAAVVIAGPSHDIDDVLPPGIALAVPLDARTLTRALVGLAGDWRLRVAMGRAGRSHAALRFELGAVVADLEEQYAALVADRTPVRPRQPSLDFPTVSVVMLTFNRRAQLREALAGLRLQSYPTDRVEFIVVDNGSSDGSAEELAAVGDDRFRVLQLDRNQPPAAARNHALNAATGDIVAFTDDDCRARPAWLETLAAGFRDGIGIVQGRTIADPSAPLGPLSRTQWTPAEYGLYETANIAYRREHLRDGGFDEARSEEIVRVLGPRFGKEPFGEDTELAWRVKRRGVASRFASGAIVAHHVYGTSLRYLFRRAVAGGAGFPVLVGQVPELRRMFLWRRIFVSRRQAELVLAVGGGAVAVAVKRPAIAATSTPYLWSVLKPGKPGRKARLLTAPVVIARDLVQEAAAIYGSARAKRIVL